MKIRFAESRPSGDFALVVPVLAGGGEGAMKLADEHAAHSGALARQRFEGEAGSVAERFSGDRRILFVGAGKDGSKLDIADKLGGTAVARLLTSGEKTAVLDLSGLGASADFAARVALAATLRAWRYDRYRTTLKDKDRPSERCRVNEQLAHAGEEIRELDEAADGLELAGGRRRLRDFGRHVVGEGRRCGAGKQNCDAQD